MNHVLKSVDGWLFTFGGQEHVGWLPRGAAKPLPTPTETEVLDVVIEYADGAYLLIWTARLSATCRDRSAPKSGDSWHETLASAEAAAQENFGIEPHHWKDCAQAG